MPKLPPPPPAPPVPCCFSARHQVVTERSVVPGFNTVLCLLRKPAGNRMACHECWLQNRRNPARCGPGRYMARLRPLLPWWMHPGSEAQNTGCCAQKGSMSFSPCQRHVTDGGRLGNRRGSRHGCALQMSLCQHCCLPLQLSSLVLCSPG